ncbi:DNA-processing protein DprA [Limibacillus halophilus]
MSGTSAFSDAEKLDWLRLIRSENVGPITFRDLIAAYGSAGEALKALPELSRRGGRVKPLRIFQKSAAEKEYEALKKLGGELSCKGERSYPRALAAIDDAPPVLSALGHLHLLARPAVALVGARNASLNGKRLARDFARALAEAGFLVVSGLARGIDAAAHQGALGGGTAAVLAGGLDQVYPEENRELQAAIAEAGLLLAEQPLGTVPQARHFPRRNRIVSGLSLGVLVVEAALRSGSLITARFALEQGREVFAIPGSPLDPRAKGGNDLIRKGALLVETAEELIAQLSPMTEPPLSEPEPGDFRGAPLAAPDETLLAKARSQLLSLLSPSAVAVDELLRECQFSTAVVNTVLLELELAGRLERHPGNKVSLLAEGA